MGYESDESTSKPKEEKAKEAKVHDGKEDAPKISLDSERQLKTIKDCCSDQHWMKAMNEELEQIKKNQTWELVPRLAEKNLIGTKWVFWNKLDEDTHVVRNKERLKCKGYSHVEGIDYEETDAPIARMEAIRMSLAFAAHMDFKIYQMDVKSAFLNE
ncbi:uncharacterized mitochondrial protein AtMg00820-like [Cryptomeria japonica]|uniref:uncharacterized mitochondrial protein AtMg00820-like n=1 Tax=Cryptomeria japonica TaxID=3369 RepID=UPI0027D9D0CF|nr:uncharacterized mitochondrial protein AtMg00820-like [Cryptomeria japonica]